MKTTILIFTLFITLIVLISCNNDDDSSTTTTSSQVVNKEYVFALVSSQEECDNSLSQGISCARSVEFYSNTEATIMVTDILNAGTYVINENTITINVPGSDSENPVIFEANNNFTELVRTSEGNELWKLKIDGINPWDL